MLLGADITIYTDHENLTFENFTSQKVLRWRLFLEEYSPKMIHKAGASNVIADCLSRLPQMTPEEGKNAAATAAYVDTSDAFCSVFDDLDLFECYVNLPVMTPAQPTPLDFTWIRQQQQQDNRLQQLAQNNPQ
eukprot:scaffold64779_cov36-Cyclotella_meneghiniana.AAC.1